MPGIDYKLAVSVAVGFGIFLLYVFQFGFFSIVGFQFASVAGVLDTALYLDFMLPFGLSIGLFFLFCLMMFQTSKQAGFDFVGWIASHQNLLKYSLVTGTVVCIALGTLLERRFPFLVLIAAHVVVLSVTAYCSAVSEKVIKVWDLVFAVLFSVGLAFSLGLYSAYYALILEPRLFNITLDGSRIESVRIVRASTSAILYSRKGSVGYLNLGKVVTIAPVD